MSPLIPDSIFNSLMADYSETAPALEDLQREFTTNLLYLQGQLPTTATPQELYQALAYTIRQFLMPSWVKTTQNYSQNKVKQICYFSTEYTLGSHLANHLVNCNLWEPFQESLKAFNLNLQDLIDQEIEPSLGYGNVAQLPIDELDSLSTLNLPAIAYGIRYEFGSFDQEIYHGWQVEKIDKWLRYGNPWEIARPEATVNVQLGGYTEAYYDQKERYRVRWIPQRCIKGVPYHTPISGYQSHTVNTLILWKAEPIVSYNSQDFNIGDYYGIVQGKPFVELLTKVLYPHDEKIQQKQLRLEQQFFFVSCSLQDMIRNHLATGENLETFHQHYSIQLHDTASAIAIAELMRLFVDEYSLEWEKSWSITRQTFTYLNPTLLPEAQEKWSVGLLGSLLPRHLEIIYEINNRLLIGVRSQYPGDFNKLSRLSLIDETGERYVRMTHLACIGSYAINGISLWQTERLKQSIIPDFYELTPEKFRAISSGITPRRWLVLANPPLAELITYKIGNSWIKNFADLHRLESELDQVEFRLAWRNIKQENKRKLADYIQQNCGITVNTDSIFDILIERIQEYKRQHLNILKIITLYNRIRKHPDGDYVPQTFIFAGKTAPGYVMGKLMIKLIHAVGQVINSDPIIGDRLKVVFIPNVNQTLSQHIYPAADVSEHLAMAGKKAGGIAILKPAFNGALTLGIVDGASEELRHAVGAENFFNFGLSLAEIEVLKAKGYNPWSYYYANESLRESIDQIASGYFSQGDPNLFKTLIDALLYHDEYMVFADYQSYIDCQDKISQTYRDWETWTRMSILNVARLGRFSSDGLVQAYCQNVWNINPV
ncbi:glycogen/starch/alpha-glucan family phosphorylase [Planktothrix agardhii]|jgi:starch phosphorylase|uniref:glycogen/starch/alpha-glucan family phosphorylase n=1 Tax=Planktothrix agardhii TaxID=1160 RepID=UPI001D0B87DC|nr:glycogen/starch/alpha-glucan phosphorylase [Planktothrix agardhii]MCB8786135.1 glycogen/starch/alpha-glucan family phosphorylase [Planktothrix agardhii 1025]MCF3614210.1 glycogen/starch/alpha-glucan family phosphorylase [Planktothrix agardhii 1027]